MSTIWLTPDEISELTGKIRWTAQCRALAGMGIAFKPNAAGRPLVERIAVCSSPSKPKKKAGPNWDALHGTAA